MSNKKKEISAQSRREDEVLNRALLWIGGAAVMILVLLLINRYYVNYRTNEVEIALALFKVLPILAGAFAVFCLAGVLTALNARKQGKSMKWSVALAAFCGVLALALAAVWRFHGTGVQVMCAVIPAISVLALVYYLFQREFFLIAVLTGAGIAGLWLIRRANGGHPAILYGYLLAVAVLLVGAALLCRRLQANGGLWNSKRILPKNAAYPAIYATCGVVAVLLIAALVAGTSVAYFLMFPAVGWLVVMAVYFTVKLM